MCTTFPAELTIETASETWVDNEKHLYWTLIDETVLRHCKKKKVDFFLWCECSPPFRFWVSEIQGYSSASHHTIFFNLVGGDLSYILRSKLCTTWARFRLLFSQDFSNFKYFFSLCLFGVCLCFRDVRFAPAREKKNKKDRQQFYLTFESWSSLLWIRQIETIVNRPTTPYHIECFRSFCWWSFERKRKENSRDFELKVRKKPTKLWHVMNIGHWLQLLQLLSFWRLHINMVRVFVCVSVKNRKSLNFNYGLRNNRILFSTFYQPYSVGFAIVTIFQTVVKHSEVTFSFHRHWKRNARMRPQGKRAASKPKWNIFEILRADCWQKCRSFNVFHQNFGFSRHVFFSLYKFINCLSKAFKCQGAQGHWMHDQNYLS